MTVLSGQTIQRLNLIEPLLGAHKDTQGNSCGLSACGYDLVLDQYIGLNPGQHRLASTFERFVLPTNVMGVVHDKSSLARRGLAVQNTVLEPGWRGYLTLEELEGLLPWARTLYEWIQAEDKYRLKMAYRAWHRDREAEELDAS